MKCEYCGDKTYAGYLFQANSTPLSYSPHQDDFVDGTMVIWTSLYLCGGCLVNLRRRVDGFVTEGLSR